METDHRQTRLACLSLATQVAATTEEMLEAAAKFAAFVEGVDFTNAEPAPQPLDSGGQPQPPPPPPHQ